MDSHHIRKEIALKTTQNNVKRTKRIHTATQQHKGKSKQRKSKTVRGSKQVDISPFNTNLIPSERIKAKILALNLQALNCRALISPKIKRLKNKNLRGKEFPLVKTTKIKNNNSHLHYRTKIIPNYPARNTNNHFEIDINLTKRRTF